MMTILKQAMNQWSSQTCIRFQQRKREHGYAYFHIGQGYVIYCFIIDTMAHARRGLHARFTNSGGKQFCNNI